MPDAAETIVIATSLSETSDDVVRTGAAAARAMGATPWLVHACSLALLPDLGALEGTWIERHVEDLRQSLARQAERTGLADLPGFTPARLRLAMGSTHGQIVDLARREEASLLVLGAAEGGALCRLGLGSTADGVIREAPCPVLVVRSASTFPPARVEIPVDLSEISANALRQGRDFLARLGVELAQTEALFVLDPLEVGSLFHFDSSRIEHFAVEELRRFLQANGAGPCQVRVRAGYPWEEILKVLEARRADLVILGTHGRRGFDRFMLGSVAAGVMRRAACNVLVVPPQAGLRHEAARSPERTWRGDWKFVTDETGALAGQP